MERRYRDRAVFFPDHGTLVIADVHLGRDATSNVEAPLGERDDVTERLAALCTHFDPDEVVIAGDLLHAFSTVPDGVTEAVRALRATVRDADARPVVTPGNHDGLLAAVWDGPVETEYALGDWVVCHGHEPPSTEAAGYVVGHDHPTIAIEGQRHPCFLSARDAYRGGDLLMLPAFTRLAPGVVVNRMRASEFGSPLVTDADAVRPIVDDGEGTLAFPPLGEFRRLL
jgi:putative SbcD/Mre11-related phosphoesterase